VIVLKDESVRFRAGWNSARAGVELKDNASEESYSGYEAYFLEYSPPVPRMKTSDGCNSESSIKQRKITSRATYLKNEVKNGIK